MQKKNLKPHKSNISPMCPDAPLGIHFELNFVVWGDIADVSTRAKFFEIGSGVSDFETPIFLFSIGLAGHPNNTTVLHCGVQ